MDHKEINAIGDLLKTLRSDDEAAVLIGFGAHGPSTDCPAGHVSATIIKAGVETTYEALNLHDALLGSRATVDRQIAAIEKKRAEEKAAA